MKFGKYAFIAAITATLFASCTQKDTHSYACTCISAAGGAKETYIITTRDADRAKDQCKSYAEPPTEMKYTCSLQ